MEIPGLSEPIINWSRYFDFLCLIMPWLDQLVRLGRLSLPWLQWAIYQLFQQWGASFSLLLSLRLFGGHNTSNLTLFCNFFYRSFGAFHLFRNQNHLIAAVPGGVCIPATNFGDIDLTLGGKICVIRRVMGWCRNGCSKWMFSTLWSRCSLAIAMIGIKMTYIQHLTLSTSL